MARLSRLSGAPKDIAREREGRSRARRDPFSRRAGRVDVARGVALASPTPTDARVARGTFRARRRGSRRGGGQANIQMCRNGSLRRAKRRSHECITDFRRSRSFARREHPTGARLPRSPRSPVAPASGNPAPLLSPPRPARSHSSTSSATRLVERASFVNARSRRRCAGHRRETPRRPPPRRRGLISTIARTPRPPREHHHHHQGRRREGGRVPGRAAAGYRSRRCPITPRTPRGGARRRRRAGSARLRSAARRRASRRASPAIARRRRPQTGYEEASSEAFTEGPGVVRVSGGVAQRRLPRPPASKQVTRRRDP